MNREIKVCDECESEYYRDSSEMISLCPNYAHKLYGYTNCKHKIENGRCIKSFWNEKTSDYLSN